MDFIVRKIRSEFVISRLDILLPMRVGIWRTRAKFKTYLHFNKIELISSGQSEVLTTIFSTFIIEI